MKTHRKPPLDISKFLTGWARILSGHKPLLSIEIGGNPDCSQCGCAVSGALHWLHRQKIPYGLGLRAGHIIDASLKVKDWIASLRRIS